MKKGFTLVELLASICILLILSTITVVVSIKNINNTKEKSYNTMINSIELAAKQYVIDNEDEIPNFNEKNYVFVTLETLSNNKYLTSALVNPMTKKPLPLTDEVYVTKTNKGSITSIYNENQSIKLELNGNYNEYVAKDSVYTDLSVTATENGTDVSLDVTTNNLVDTSTEGEYKITYTYNGISIDRNVIVYQKEESSGDSTITLKNYVTNLYNNLNTRTLNGLIKDDTTNENIRYAGSNLRVKNYVWFNCTDGYTSGISHCEKWRIIGVFGNEVKIVRDESIGSYSWDSSTENNGKGINEWSVSDIKVALNTLYYNKQSGTCYNGNNNATTSCNFTSTGIKSNTKEMIKTNATWYTGAAATGDNDSTTITSLDAYTNERNVSNNGYGCNNSGSDCTDTVTRTTTWTGAIGLINYSDYGYASDICNSVGTNTQPVYFAGYNKPMCKNSNWLSKLNYNQWTITPQRSSNISSVVWSIPASENYISYASLACAIRPALFLKSDIIVIGGIGTEDNPYQIKVPEA